MMQTSVDYTIFFRELSTIPDDIGPLKKSFYSSLNEEMEKHWSEWLTKWRLLITSKSNENAASNHSPEATEAPDAPEALDAHEEISRQMKLVNPKYTLREWLLVPAYQQAVSGDYSLIRELQEVMTQPYAEQTKDVEEKYYRLKPSEFNEIAGVSHLSCSS